MNDVHQKPEIENTALPESQTEQKKEEKNVLMASLAYIGPLVIVSYLTSKDDPFVKFHIKQGLVLFTTEIGIWVLMSVFWLLFPIWQIANFAVFVLAIIGIVNAAGKKEKDLPLVGKYAKHFAI